MAETRPKPVAPAEPVPEKREEKDPPTDSGVRELILQTEILDELRRMNRLLAGISRGPRRYTLAFFSGIVRGLGAAIGATVVFALLIGLLTRVNTIPLIGSYIARVLEFAATASPVIGDMRTRMGPEATPTETVVVIPTDATPEATPDASATPPATPAP